MSSNLVNHYYDYRLNWAPLSSITIIDWIAKERVISVNKNPRAVKRKQVSKNLQQQRLLNNDNDNNDNNNNNNINNNNNGLFIQYP